MAGRHMTIAPFFIDALSHIIVSHSVTCVGLGHRVAASCNCELRVHFERSYCSFAPDKRAFVPGVVRARRYFYTFFSYSQLSNEFIVCASRLPDLRKLAEPN